MAHPFAHLARDPRFDSLKDVPVLVTGGAGFIGSHLVDALIALRARVVVLDNLATSSLANLEHHLGHSKVATLQELVRDFRRPILTNGAGGSLTLVVGDIRTPEHCALAMGLVTAGTGKTVPKPQIVFHLAALGSVPRSVARPAETVDVNVGGTARVFEAARDAGVQRVVYASSSSVYGDSPHLPKREGEEGQPVSPYALSKSQCERLAQTFGRWWAMEFVGLRYFNVFGPRQS
ncbi:MAG: NAD-dependent epimerase/dehydratase family protein, partial [Thermoanaerobaculum sp.]